MANTYTLIASNTLGSSAASVTFSSIPSTYTDLVVRVSTRSTRATDVFDAVTLYLNGNSTSTNYNRTIIRGSGSAVSSFAGNQPGIYSNNSGNGAGATANTFGSAEFYIPNYTSSTNKPASVFGVTENNATEAYIVATAGLALITSAVTSIEVAPGSGSYSFVSGSSFFLYGIKAN